MEYEYTLYQKAKRHGPDTYICNSLGGSNDVISLPQYMSRSLGSEPFGSFTLIFNMQTPYTFNSLYNANLEWSDDGGGGGGLTMGSLETGMAFTTPVRARNIDDEYLEIEENEATPPALKAQASMSSVSLAKISEEAPEDLRCTTCYITDVPFNRCPQCKKGPLCSTCCESYKRLKCPRICPACRFVRKDIYTLRRGRPPRNPPQTI